ncbi:MAG: hypothetical protein PVJ49_17940 [Acidobacteriota bacterium]
MNSSDCKRNAKPAAMALAALLIGATTAGAAKPPAPARPQAPRADDVVTELVAVVVPPIAALPAAKLAQQRALLTAELDGMRLERAAEAAMQRVEITRIAKLAEVGEVTHFAELSDIEALPDVRFVYDRDLDTADQVSWAFDVYAADECPDAPSDSIWSAAADMVVSAARLPARAGAVVRAVLGTFAKVTPRVVRALL